jgi:hypothetical protein
MDNDPPIKQWLDEEIEKRGARWVLEACLARRDNEEHIEDLCIALKDNEVALTAQGITFPGCGGHLLPVATQSVKRLAGVR